MRSVSAVFAVLGACVLLLQGCGGGGGGDDDSAPAAALNEAPGAGERMLRFSAGNARWLAWRDGDGSWQSIGFSAGQPLSLEVNSADGRFAVAFVCSDSPRDHRLELFYSSLSEGAALSSFSGFADRIGLCEEAADTPPSQEFSAQLTGVRANEVAALQFNSGGGQAAYAGVTQFPVSAERPQFPTTGFAYTLEETNGGAATRLSRFLRVENLSPVNGVFYVDLGDGVAAQTVPLRLRGFEGETGMIGGSWMVGDLAQPSATTSLTSYSQTLALPVTSESLTIEYPVAPGSIGPMAHSLYVYASSNGSDQVLARVVGLLEPTLAANDEIFLPVKASGPDIDVTGTTASAGSNWQWTSQPDPRYGQETLYTFQVSTLNFTGSFRMHSVMVSPAWAEAGRAVSTTTEQNSRTLRIAGPV